MRKQRCKFTAGQIAEACGGRVVGGDPDAVACGVTTDSRQAKPGQAFFALAGARHDGHDYVGEAVRAGASVVVVHSLPPDAQALDGAALVLVPQTERALLALAAEHRGHLKGRVAAVTGSYGKSTVKQMLGLILSQEGTCTVAPASFNNRIGVALSLLAASCEDDYVVLEMGTNHPGEIDELARAARPDVGVITAVAEVHLEGLGSLEGVREAKGELIPHLPAEGSLVLNADDPLCASLAERFGGRVATFGAMETATVRPERIVRQGNGWRFDACGWTMSIPSSPLHNVANAAAAICAAQCLGLPPRSAALALAEFRPERLRYQRLVMGGVTFICDCYNSNPPAMRAAVRSFLLEPCRGRRVVVFGDMLELGAGSPRLHDRMGAELAQSGIEHLVAVGLLARNAVAGWHGRANPSQRAYWFPSAEEVWEPLWWELRPGDAVLIKGSRAMKLETITERISAWVAAEPEEEAA
jgi:UDP-N-acetylmuramoyl-tripeptide--D-alanyl-D-alanine ligase